jgi:hypothetical protein
MMWNGPYFGMMRAHYKPLPKKQPLSELFAADRLNAQIFAGRNRVDHMRAEFIALHMKRRKTSASTVFRQLQTYCSSAEKIFSIFPACCNSDTAVSTGIAFSADALSAR